jgi:hypothetical protein
MGQPAVRMSDLTAHRGSIILGLPTVLIGERYATWSAGVVTPPSESRGDRRWATLSVRERKAVTAATALQEKRL